jgi:hypothetical protein
MWPRTRLPTSCLQRNDMPAPYPSEAAAREAYNFQSLQSFLDLYYAGCAVLRKTEDFYVSRLQPRPALLVHHDSHGFIAKFSAMAWARFFIWFPWNSHSCIHCHPVDAAFAAVATHFALCIHGNAPALVVSMRWLAGFGLPGARRITQ